MSALWKKQINNQTNNHVPIVLSPKIRDSRAVTTTNAPTFPCMTSIAKSPMCSVMSAKPSVRLTGCIPFLAD